MDLTITKDKVLAAAATCPDAKRVLEKMFPEVFVEDLSVIIDPFTSIKDKSGVTLIEPRRHGSFAGKALWLYNYFNWEIHRDEIGTMTLVPTRKPMR